MFTVVIGRDEVGEFPLLLLDRDALPSGAFRWRVAAQTDDFYEAVGVVEVLNRQCFSKPLTVA